jgi:hypothetical protein
MLFCTLLTMKKMHIICWSLPLRVKGAVLASFCILSFHLPPSTFHLPPVLEDSYALLMDWGESNDESLVRDIEE